MNRALRIEWLFVALLGLALGWCALHFARFGYLPLPFFPNPGDTLMDGYNSAWWAYEGHVYDMWRAIYPPLPFVLLRWFSIDRCYGLDPLLLRDCDWALKVALATGYLANGWIAWRAFRMTDRASAAPRTIALMLGLPMLYALDRGQTLIFGLTAFFLGYGPVLASSRARMFAAAFAVNIKPYMIAPLLAQLVGNRWRWVEGALVATLLLWVLSVALFGEGDPVTLYRNIVEFSGDASRAGTFSYVSYATSYNTLIRFLSSNSPMAVGGAPWTGTIAAMRFALSLTQLASVALIGLIWLRRHPASRSRLALLFYALALMSSEVGGYAEAGLIFLVFLEKGEGRARMAALVCAYLLCLPIDLTIAPGVFPNGRIVEGWLGGHIVRAHVDLTIGPFLRPGLILGIQWAMIARVWGEMQQAPRPALKLRPA